MINIASVRFGHFLRNSNSTKHCKAKFAIQMKVYITHQGTIEALCKSNFSTAGSNG